MNKNIIRILCTLLLATLLAGCERRPLVDTTREAMVKVRIKINSIVNVTTGVYNEHIPLPDVSPNVIRVMFYDVNTKQVRTQGFISKKGVDVDGTPYLIGEVSVRPGTYDVLCYNFDTPSTIVSNENNWNTITAYTSEISDLLYTRLTSRSPETMPLPTIYYEPDHLLVAREEKIHIPEHTETLVIETEATSVVDSYYIQIRLKNGKYASDASAVLTDLSPSNRIGPNEREHTEYAATFFEMHRSTDPRIRADNQEVLCAVFNTFGKREDHIDPSVESQLYVTFNVITTEGKIVDMTVDMDSIFKTEPAIEKHWLLIDKVFEIPEPESGGFKPSVDKWDEENGYVDII